MNMRGKGLDQLLIVLCNNTHSAATNKYNKEALDGTARAHDPRHPNEEDNTEDILQTRKVDTHEGAQVGFFWSFLVGVIGSILNGG